MAVEYNFKQMERSSTVDSVINQIKNHLVTGKIKPGDKLPSENELCQSLGVSRGSLRAAMKVFEALGVVDILVGDGTYVRTELSPNNFNPLILSLIILQPGFDTLSEFRSKIELDILDLIINDSILTSAIVPKLEENLEMQRQMRARNAAAEEFAENDKDFHDILAKGCNNIIFQTVYSFVFELFWPYILKSHNSQEFGKVAASEHVKILNAIEAGDFSLAKIAVGESVKSWSKLVEKDISKN